MADTFISSGVSSDGIVLTGEKLYVENGGEAVNTTVNEGGRMYVSSGGRIQVSSGGILTGSMSIANGGSVSAYEGAILDFDLTRVFAEAPALVNDLSLVKGAPACTLTVSASQASGTYKLADGAAEFSGTITIQNTYGDSFGTFTVGQTVYAGDSRFTLNLTDGTLSVTVNGPTVTDESGDVATGSISVEVHDDGPAVSVSEDSFTVKESHSVSGILTPAYGAAHASRSMASLWMHPSVK